MDVRLSPEQQALRDAAARMVDRLAPGAVGQIEDRERAARLEAAVTDAGWRQLREPGTEPDGRTGTPDGDQHRDRPASTGPPAVPPLASAVEVALVAEELGRGPADLAFLGPTLAAELRRLAGAPPAPAPETVVFGRSLGGFAAANYGALSDGAVAVDAGRLSAALVLVPSPGGCSLARVGWEASGSGRATTARRSDLTRPVITLDPTVPTTAVPDQARAVTPADVTRLTALGLALTSADLVGAMRGAVTLTCGYAAERRQYGVAVGSFQAVQHLLADAHTLTEGSRSTALHAAWAADALPPDEALAAAAAAKAYCSRAARTVCETAIQVHGGIGNTWECLAHVFLRRTFLSSEVFGGVGPNLTRVLEHRGIRDPRDTGDTKGRDQGAPRGTGKGDNDGLR